MERLAYILYFGANLAPRAMMFVLLLVLTHLMPMAEYGLLVLVVTTGELFDMALIGWVRVFALRSDSAGGALRPYRFGRILSLSIWTTLASLVIAAVVLAGHDHAVPFTVAVMSYILAFAPLRLGLLILQVRRVHVAYAAVEGLRAAGVLLAVGVCVAVLGPHFIVAALAVSAATFAAGVGGLVVALRGVPRPRRARTGYKAALAFGLPIMAAGLLNQAIGFVDRYIVDALMGAHAVAILAAAFALARQPIDLFIGSLNNYAFPHLVRVYEQKGPEATSAAQAGLLVTMTMVGGAITIGLILLANPLIATFLPESYRAEGTQLVPWLALGTFFLTVKVFVFDNIFHLSKRTWMQPLAMLMPSIIGVGLCIFLVQTIGLTGAGYSYATAGFASLLMTAALTLRIIPIAIPWTSLGKVAIALVGAGLALYLARSLAAHAGPLSELIGGASAFIVVYASLLTLFGISVRRAVEVPWDVVPGRRVFAGVPDS